MQDEIKIIIIIPCYNEQDNILMLYKELCQFKDSSDYNITPLFINDCSIDTTRAILEKNQIPHINLPINLGIGGAMQTGFKYALLNNFDIAVQMDGDGQHPPGELEKLLSPIINKEADVTIGSRYMTKEGFQSSWLRRFGISYFSKLIQLLTGFKIMDTTSGYRALNQKALKEVVDYYPDEYPEPESLILFASKNLKIQEVSVVMRERAFGKSSIRHYKTIYYMFKVTLGIIFLYIRLKFNAKRHII